MYEPWSLDAAAGRSVAPARFWPVVAAPGATHPRPRRSGRGGHRAPPSAPPRLGPAVAAGDASGPTWTDERVTRVRPGAGCHASAANRRRATGPVRSGARGRPNLRVATVSNHAGNRTGFALTIVGETRLIVHAAATRRRQRRAVRGAPRRKPARGAGGFPLSLPRFEGGGA